MAFLILVFLFSMLGTGFALCLYYWFGPKQRNR